MGKQNPVLKNLTAAEISKLFDECGSIYKIAKKLNISYSALHKKAKRLGVLRASERRKNAPNIELDEKILKKYEELRSVVKTGKFFGLSESAIRNHLPEGWQETYKLNFGKKQVCNDWFFHIVNEESAYWAFFILADGTVDWENNRLKIGLASKDAAHIEEFKKQIKYTGMVSTRSTKRYRLDGSEMFNTSISIHSTQIIEDLKTNFNVVPNKTYVGFDFPTSCMNNEFTRAALRGYLDGDGWCRSVERDERLGKPELACGICSANLGFINEYKNQLEWLTGLELGKIKQDVRPHYKIPFYMYEVAGNNNIRKIRELLYNDASTFLQRKKDVFYSINDVIYDLRSPIRATNIETGEILTFESRNQSYEFGFNKSGVRAALNGTQTHHHGFRFEYIDKDAPPTNLAA